MVNQTNHTNSFLQFYLCTNIRHFLQFYPFVPHLQNQILRQFVINRIKNREMLKSLSIEYSVDRSILSRVKNNKAWKYAHEVLNKRNAQRLSKAPLREW